MYYIIENQIRADGNINNIVTSRTSYDMALSFYYDRMSKMLVTELFPKVAISLQDEELNLLKHDVVNTRYTEQGAN